MRVYLDAAPVIYTVEQIEPFAQLVDERLAVSGWLRVASDLTRLECRVKPLRNGDTALLQDFELFFTNDISEIVTLTRAVMDRATEVRAQFGFKTADAIHLAAANVAKCDVFLTNDHRLDRFTQLIIEVIQPRNSGISGNHASSSFQGVTAQVNETERGRSLELRGTLRAGPSPRLARHRDGRLLEMAVPPCPTSK